VLFVRAPILGRVKTRLAADLGNEAACHLYQAMVADILGQIRSSSLPLSLFHDGGMENNLPPSWSAGAFRVRPQHGGDIGARMAAAFAECFAAGIDQVLLAGSDIPDLAAAHLTAAVAALVENDAVLAPAVDGGYGLIGLNRTRYRSEIFTGIPWSTDRVLETTRQRCAICGLTVHLLPMLRDIDTLDDLLAYRQHPNPAAVATNATLTQILTGMAGAP
jgi:uncharacterized protein